LPNPVTVAKCSCPVTPKSVPHATQTKTQQPA
jgi:hypothetical protein